jgi:hypothetical protein
MEAFVKLEYAHYYRNRFTVIKLSRMPGVQPFGLRVEVEG